jgi:NADP-dependent 3-hydroxy acid dehydrogenase YdfG
MSGGLAERVAVVTGASSGIGRATALHLAAAGATVCLVARRAEALDEVVRAAGPAGSRTRPYRTDLTDDRDIAELVAAIERDFGRVDVLVHSAGAIASGSVDTASVADFDRQYRANVRGPYALTQGLLPMLKKRGGDVVFINSTVGLKARATVGQFAATQHAIKAIADSLRDEVNADGVRVLSIYLGRTATPRQAAIFQAENRPYRPELLLSPDDVAATVTHVLTLPARAEVTEIAMRPAIKSY